MLITTFTKVKKKKKTTVNVLKLNPTITACLEKFNPTITCSLLDSLYKRREVTVYQQRNLMISGYGVHSY